MHTQNDLFELNGDSRHTQGRFDFTTRTAIACPLCGEPLYETESYLACAAPGCEAPLYPVPLFEPSGESQLFEDEL